jgi:hypothetical protein
VHVVEPVASTAGSIVEAVAFVAEFVADDIA